MSTASYLKQEFTNILKAAKVLVIFDPVPHEAIGPVIKSLRNRNSNRS